MSITWPGEENLSLIQRINGALQLIPDFPETCKSILDAVIEEMGAENCSLMLKDPISNLLVLRAARGREDGRSNYYSTEFSPGKRFEVGEGVAGWVIQQGEPLMLDDVSQDPQFVDIEGSRSQVRSLLCVPIREDGQTVGVFNLSCSRRAAFSEYDKLALSYISTQVGAVLSSTRYVTELQGIQKLQERGRTEKTVAADSANLLHETPLGRGEIRTGEESPQKSRYSPEAPQEERSFYVDESFIFFGQKMDRIREVIDQVANTDVTVLIQGESGVGKEIVARALHHNSPRRDKPFIKVNCAALPEELLESELFGYEKGAFTGAYRQKPGKFELAHSGTIFLDEIGDISPSLQAKLLQVLQDGEFSRLGGKTDVQVDVRVLVATNKDLEEAVRVGRFREDFYYRLNVVNIFVPPLRERRQEIPVFIDHFLNTYSKKYDKNMSPPSPRLMKMFTQHPWLGNIRELENMIKRLVLLSDEGAIIEELSSEIKRNKVRQKSSSQFQGAMPPILPLKEVGRRAAMHAEREAILKVLGQTNWNRKKAAKLLHISYKAILYKIKEYGLTR
jgi:transcriptional regulator with GAF, ATPase, and Fis domain